MIELVGMMFQFCAAVGDDITHCDVRVKYVTTYTTVAQCDDVAKRSVDKMVLGMAKHQPELVMYSHSGKCYSHADLKEKLNTLPDFMDEIGRTFHMTFY